MTRKQKKLLIRIIVSFVLLIGCIFIPVDGIWKLLIYLVPYFIAGYDVIKACGVHIIHGNFLDEKFLMTIATAGAFAIGEYTEAVAVMLFFQVGELFQGIAVGRSRRSISDLMDLKADYATVIRDGEEIRVEPDEVAVGEIIVIKAGEKVPLDGVVTEGNGKIDTASLTGESRPVAVAEGEEILSGSINLEGVIKVSVTGVYEDSTVAKILQLVEESSEKKAKVENFITRFAKWYTPVVVGAAVLIAVLPPLILRQPFTEWLYRALIFLVVSCPCALVVSVPLTFFAGIGRASHEGILVKGSNYLELLASVDTVMFDKTGTLTEGKFRVTGIETAGTDERELLRIAASIESYSTHPIADSIIEAYGEKVRSGQVTRVTEHAGKGIEADLDGRTYYIGNRSLMTDIAGTDPGTEDTGYTTVYVSDGETCIGRILLGDSLKKDAPETVASLSACGIKNVVMLTGDRRSAAERTAEEAGIEKTECELLPSDKVASVEKYIGCGNKVAFVGDGINDAPVLSRADVGIAMGGLGSDAAIESADIVLMNDRPSDICTAIKIARKIVRIARENIVIAIAIKVLILILSVIGIANMWFAVFGDVGVLILAILNSLRAMGRVR